ICSRHQFGVRNGQFWRRDSFSSPFWGEKWSILTTRLVLVTILSWETANFDDEIGSRHHFEAGNAQF
ncbi:hypothetical protein LI012_18735, partial [Caldibacillus thermoamylovorans]|uniref:hypothetical protein n=1 Tax=Caldibacillus thermoamylovorans TaxID=35841 RepID=UPI001D07A820